jgi:hypothetical protein
MYGNETPDGNRKQCGQNGNGVLIYTAFPFASDVDATNDLLACPHVYMHAVAAVICWGGTQMTTISRQAATK